MKTALVTGGSGFVGAALVRRLVGDGHAVHLLLRPQHHAWRIADLAGRIDSHVLDVTEGRKVREVLDAVRPDWIFNLMTHGAYSHQQDPGTIVGTNVLGTTVLLNAAVQRGFEAFINAGSSSEYGFVNGPTREAMSPDPNSLYAVTKVAATLLGRHLARSTGLHIRTLRLYSVYGPFEEPTRLMARLIAAARWNALPALASPDTTRDFVYVSDAVEAFMRAATTAPTESGAVINICTGVQTSLRQLVDICRRELGVTAEPHWGTMASRAWDTSHWVGDASLAATELQWRATTTVADGLRAFREWLATHPALWPRYEAGLTANER